MAMDGWLRVRANHLIGRRTGKLVVRFVTLVRDFSVCFVSVEADVVMCFGSVGCVCMTPLPNAVFYLDSTLFTA